MLLHFRMSAFLAARIPIGLSNEKSPSKKFGSLNLELRRYVNRSETSEYISISIPPASWIRGNSTSAMFEVTKKESEFDGYIFRSGGNALSGFSLWEVPIEALPSVEGFKYLVTTGFYSLPDFDANADVELYVPTSRVLKTEDIPSVDIYSWSNVSVSNDAGWSSSSFKREDVIHNNVSYIKFTINVPVGLSIIAVPQN